MMVVRVARQWQVAVLALASVFAGACSGDKAPDPRSASAPAAAAVQRVPSQASATVDARAITVPQQDVGGLPRAPAGDSSPTRAHAATRTPPARPTPAGPRHVVLGGVDLTGVGYDRGSVTAPVVMIDLSDFACPYCGQFSRETFPTIERDYVRTGRVFFKYVPFVVGSFPHSAEATRATECAADQGAFWPMMQRVYDAQGTWRSGGDPYPVLRGLASAAGLDTTRIRACYDSRRTDVRTARATNVATDLGVRVTPSFIVNERPIQGALPLAEFRKVIDAALLVSQLKK